MAGFVGTGRAFGGRMKGLEVMKKCLFSSIASDLKGRDLVTLETLTSTDITSLLWTALDLKEKQPSNSKICNGKSIFMISDDPIRRISLSHAASCVGASVAFGDSFIGPPAKQKLDMSLFGKTVASTADIMFLDSQNLSQEESELIAAGSTVPVVSVSHADFCPVVCLAELMTLYEKHLFLRRLIVSYVGYGNDPVLNTYALLLPKVGINLRYLVPDSMNTLVWEKAVRISNQNQTEFQQSGTLEDVVYRSHVISTCPESERQLDVKDLKEMHLDWSLLHKDVYKGITVTGDLLRSSHCLVWNSLANTTWIFQAIIASLTKGYKPTIARPEFEGVP